MLRHLKYVAQQEVLEEEENKKKEEGAHTIAKIRWDALIEGGSHGPTGYTV